MTRKDTIMIAVLVNAALLVALFVSAIHMHDYEKPYLGHEMAPQIKQVPPTIVEIKPLPCEPKMAKEEELKVTQGDEVDRILKEFSEKKQIDLTKELEAISKVTQTPKKEEETDNVYYVVKKGDNPWSIAAKNHIKLEDLLKLNNLNEDKAKRLRPGDKLRIR